MSSGGPHPGPCGQHAGPCARIGAVRTTLTTQRIGIAFGLIAVTACIAPLLIVLARADPPAVMPVGVAYKSTTLLVWSVSLGALAYLARRSCELGQKAQYQRWNRMLLISTLGVLCANAAVTSSWTQVGLTVRSGPFASSLFTSLALHVVAVSTYLVALIIVNWSAHRRDRPVTLRTRAALLQAVSLPVAGLGVMAALAGVPL
jgi:heme/copper-type cytochrome/quinol oxidase subunit 3